MNTSMQNTSDQTLNLPASVQALLPTLSRLNIEQKMTLMHLLTSDIDSIQTTGLSDVSNEKFVNDESKRLMPLDRQYFSKAWVSDDFNNELGDEFWLGEDT